MPFCVEYFDKNSWKILKNTISTSKEQAVFEKERIQAQMGKDDKFLTVSEGYRIRKMRAKEAKAILGSKDNDKR
jgi:hypothetical protein